MTTTHIMFRVCQFATFILVLHTCYAQGPPCSLKICATNKYCSEKPSGDTECLDCHPFCLGCAGPTVWSCVQCKVGYYKSAEPTPPCEECPVEKFGVNCSSTCHCLDNENCNKTNGYCLEWKCERGFRGLPFCRQVCELGTFGLDCKYLCHCPDGDNCSHVNGDCSSMRCHADWDGAGCQIRLPKLALGPTVVSSACNSITLAWDAFNKSTDIGTGPVGEYIVYLRKGRDPWEKIATKNAPDTVLRYTHVVNKVFSQDETYFFRIDSHGLDSEKYRQKISPGNPSEAIVNMCTTMTPRESTTVFLVSRKVFKNIVMVAVNSNIIRLDWTVEDLVKNLNFEVLVTYKLLGNGDCDDNARPEHTSGPYNITDKPIAIDDLFVWSRYQISIIAVATTMNVRHEVLQVVITKPGTPTGTVRNLNEDRLTSTEASISWSPLPCSERKGPMRYYTLKVKNLNDTGSDFLSYLINGTSHDLDNLQPYTTYAVTVTYVNLADDGLASEEFYFSTPQGAPSPVEIENISPTYSTVTVTFRPPIKLNGVLQDYLVSYSETQDFGQSVTVTRDASSVVGNSILVDSLRPETDYHVRMAASTSGATGQYGQMKQVTTASSPTSSQAITLSLKTQTTNCLIVKWDPPQDYVKEITGYVLTVRKASAETIVPPIREEQISANQSSFQQCDLRPSSLYIVTITANSVDGLVSSATQYFSTKHGQPPRPSVPTFVKSQYTNFTLTLLPIYSPDIPITAYQIMVLNVAPSRNRRAVGVPGTVYAQLTPEQLTESSDFVVGDGKTYAGYKNSVLEPEHYYKVYYVILSTLNNETTVSHSETDPILTVPYDPALVPPLAVSVSDKTTDCLSLTWDTPVGVLNTVTDFTIVVEETQEQPILLKTVDLPPTTSNYTICDLQPFTLFTVRVIARSAGVTTSVGSGTFLTAQETPRKPVAPAFVNSSYSTITVALEPLALTGAAPLTMYQIYVQKLTNRRKRSTSEVMVRTKRMAGVPGTVSAQLSPTDIPQTIHFVVGDGVVYGGFENKALDRDTLYTVHYVAVSTVANDTKFSYSSLNPPVTTVPYILPTQALALASDEDNGVLIGVIIALIILVIIIILLIPLYWWWKRRNTFNPYEIHDDEHKTALSSFKDDYDPEKYWSQIYDHKDCRHIVAGRQLLFVEGGRAPFASGQIPDIPNIPKVNFKNEFQALPHKSKQATDNIARQNKKLNRFPHLLPYDHSLVQLRPDSNSNSAYINASFIPGYKKIPAYIAAQSPFDDRTVLDFWRLIFQRNIKTVVMITNIVEDNIMKCTQYWPDSTKARYGNFMLQLIECTEYADYIVRTIGVTLAGDEHSRVVRLFEFTSWPNHGVPDDPIPFLEMRYKVRRYHNTEPGPILVHCGTGISRTGVFIAVDSLINQYAEEGRVTTFDFVRRMRKDRPYMVRTLKQYVFIYETLFEEFHAGDTLIDFDLKERYRAWTRPNPNTEHSYLRDQYQLLENFTRYPRIDHCKTGLLEMNRAKNRYLDIIPADHQRPVLKSPGGLNITDYVNALYVDGYLRKNQFIVTQTPLHTTILDFWKLIYDEDVHTIVMVENFKNEDDTCAEYWPSVNMKQFEPFFIETTASFQQDNITIRNFKIYSTDAPRRAAKCVRQFQFNAWAEPNLTPQSKTLMLDLIDVVFDWQEEACKNERPVVVHCQDGASHSGLFAILAVICEKMEEDEEVDIYRTIKHIKRRRPQFVSDYDQFRFCYKTVWDFMNLRMPGGMFTDTLGQNKMDKFYGVASLSLTSKGDTYFNTVDLDNTTEL